MATKMSEEEIFAQAKKRVEAKRGFYRHLFAYLLVNVILVLVWAFAAGRGYQWFWWVIGGWGIGLLVNFVEVFFWPKGSDQAAIEKEADKIRGDKR